MRAWIQRMGAVLGTAWIAGCGGGGDGDGGNESVAGPCFIQSNGPSLTIATAANTSTGAAIPVLTLSDIKIGGMVVPTLVSGDWVNIKAAGANLECTVACGFSSMEGVTTFVVTAPGYASKAISTTSSYATRVGGCPGSNSNGARIAVLLDPL